MAEAYKPRETLPYICREKFRKGFLSTSNFVRAAQQYRDFVSDKQYVNDEVNGFPKPKVNICAECAEKTSAKILETKPAVEFVANSDDKNLQKMDDFYEYLMDSIDNDEYNAKVVWNGIVDGIGVCMTSFDQDTKGVRSAYKGFLKRDVVPFEEMFFANPYCEDVQDQAYIGRVMQMDVEQVKELLEDKSEENLSKIVPEDWFDNPNYAGRSLHDIDFDVCNVYLRFFRIDGEVVFEMSTKYVDLFKNPHYLNPSKNESNLKKEYEERLKAIEDSNERGDADYKGRDPEKYAIFEKAKPIDESSETKDKGKFDRYPISIYRPLPVNNCILGQSYIKFLISNQRVINYNMTMMSLIIQNHAMPKYMAKPDALKGQVIDNSPNQIITDYTPITAGVQWGLTRMNPGDAVNSNLVEITNSLIRTTREVRGFADLSSDQNVESGYQYEQMVHQANLPLQQPQKRYWSYIKNNARTDLLYLRFYVKEARYFSKMSDSEMEMNDNYRSVSQRLIDTGKIEGLKGYQGKVLPNSNRVESQTVNEDLFMNDFDININVCQGIASNIVSESQHYENVFTMIAQGNMDADKIRVMIQNDPAFTTKTRSRLMASLDALEFSQLQMKNQEIDQLTGTIEQMSSVMGQYKQAIDLLKQRDTARTKSLQDSVKQNAEFAKSLANSSQSTMSESEVKSNNAKGISGGTFDKN